MISRETEKFITSRLKQAFPSLPVRLQLSPAGDSALWVEVFCVPSKRVREVKDFIYSLQDAVSEVMLLAMVKSEETTRRHYPQYVTDASLMSFCANVLQHLEERAPATAGWEPAKRTFVYASGFHSPREAFERTFRYYNPDTPDDFRQTGGNPAWVFQFQGGGGLIQSSFGVVNLDAVLGSTVQGKVCTDLSVGVAPANEQLALAA